MPREQTGDRLRARMRAANAVRLQLHALAYNLANRAVPEFIWGRSAKP